MESLVKGVHHITLCPGGAQEDVDFFTQVLGQRLVKQTVLMDGSIPIYHLYYANADVERRLRRDHVSVHAASRAAPGPASCLHQLHRAERGDRVLEGALRSPQGRAQRRAGAVRREVHPRSAIRPGCCSR